MRSSPRTSTLDMISTGSALLGGAILGAAAMMILDPQRGRSRRAYLGQKMKRLSRTGTELVQGAGRDITNRTRGSLASTASWIRHRSDTDIEDTRLEARVRSRMGHCISHPAAVHVEASNGCIILTGDILASEAGTLLRTIRSVPGVLDVEDRLEKFDDPTHVPSLQGGRTFRRRTGMLGSPGIVGLFSLLAGGVAIVSVTRLLNMDLTGLISTGAGHLQHSGRLDWELDDDVEALERVGDVPEWTKEPASGSVHLDRVR